MFLFFSFIFAGAWIGRCLCLFFSFSLPELQGVCSSVQHLHQTHISGELGSFFTFLQLFSFFRTPKFLTDILFLSFLILVYAITNAELELIEVMDSPTPV
ncbi:hypothetical protein TWF106_004559 [Orbilia oligospora]|uniref:Uncharacterized protein n=1 Tax=Orbilia oligospora TaxID=2813651 RepID=A0A6G1LWE4_ORBOL|nr:hypothetical protein TWF788_002452 [Orbilia oligospora]KAF3196691.1 hypothetical protein TWF679_004554 [Orbilia oligospora]KAF3198568.1 hypothetical protein TWF106_004559 [Orbilia oligospora]KAF3210098.1 hypothetical protein TWF191_011285 [Orbilia oligospora]KAF3236785.1 hypothetical protein TWF192_011338 [Orbilia oligospora]